MAGPESRLSEKVRRIFEDIGCDVTQVVDAGVPGPSDLIIEWPGHYIWLELKVGSPLRPEQRHFLRRHWARYRNAYLLRMTRSRGAPFYLLWPGDRPLAPGVEVWSGSSLDAQAIIRAIESSRGIV